MCYICLHSLQIMGSLNIVNTMLCLDLLHFLKSKP